MKTVHKIENIHFVNNTMMLTVDEKSYSVNLSKVSAKLAAASDKTRNDFRTSPSGYGIHWPQIDEDLSIDGLINSASIPQVAKHKTRKRV
jgi:hypothetical protein